MRKFVELTGRLLAGIAPFFVSGLSFGQDLAEQSHHAKELMAEGRFTEAVPIYQKLVEALPGNPGLILNLGLAEEMAGQPQKAIPHLQAVLKAQPDSVPALTTLAMAEVQVKEPGAAVPILQKLVQIQPQDPRAWYQLGKAYEALATHAFDELSKSAPQSPYVAALVADSRLQSKQYRSAFFFYRQAQSKLPDLPGIHAGLATVYENTGHADWAEAERKRERQPPIIKRSAPPGSPESLFWATKAYNQQAIQAFDHLGQLPESVELHALKAEILRGHGQNAEAAEEWNRALALAPGDKRLETELATSLFQAREYDKAMPLLRSLLADEKDAADLNFMLGDSLLRAERPEQALPYLTAAVKADPHLLQAQAALGMAYTQLNQNANAIPHLEQAVGLDDDGSIHYALARAYKADGRAEEAGKALAEYQKIKQRNQQIDEELSKEAEITGPK